MIDMDWAILSPFRRYELCVGTIPCPVQPMVDHGGGKRMRRSWRHKKSMKVMKVFRENLSNKVKCGVFFIAPLEVACVLSQRNLRSFCILLMGKNTSTFRHWHWQKHSEASVSWSLRFSTMSPHYNLGAVMCCVKGIPRGSKLANWTEKSKNFS